MRTETFNEISFSDESKFDRKNGKIQLKEYRDNLIFYDPFDITIDPTFCSGDKTAIPATQDYEIMNFGVFAQHVVNRTTIKFDSSNFYSLKDEGSIQVRIRADFSNGYVYQEFLSNQVTLADGVYDFTLKLNTTSYLVSVELSHSDTLDDIASAISLYFYDNSIQAGAMIVNGNLRITTYSVEDTLEVSEGEELSLLQALGGIGEVKVLNKPVQDITFLSLKNSIDNKNRIDLVHTKNGDLTLNLNGKTLALCSFLKGSKKSGILKDLRLNLSNTMNNLSFLILLVHPFTQGIIFIGYRFKADLKSIRDLFFLYNSSN